MYIFFNVEMNNMCQLIYTFFIIGRKEVQYANVKQIFQNNFRKKLQNNNIRYKLTANSINSFCKYYIAFYSDFFNINYNTYMKIVEKLNQNINRCPKQQLEKVNLKVLLDLLTMLVHRYQLTLKDTKLYENVLKILLINKQKLKIRDHIRIYFTINKNYLSAVNAQLYQFILLNNQQINKMLKDLSKVDYITISYFIRNCPTYNNQDFNKLYTQVFNWWIAEQSIDKLTNLYDLLAFFKLIIIADSKNSSLKILTPQNKDKLTQFFIKFLETTQKLGQNQKAKTVPGALLKSNFINSQIAYKLRPYLSKSQIFKNNRQIIFYLATKNVFDQNYIKFISNFILINIKPQQNMHQKIEQLQIMCIISLYLQNLPKLAKQNPKFTQTYSVQIQNMTVNMEIIKKELSKLCQLQNFTILFSGLQFEYKLMQTFHMQFGQIFFDKLIKKVKQYSTVKLLQYCIVACKSKDIIKVCEHLQPIMTIKLLTKLLWHFENLQKSNVSYMYFNLILILNYFSYFYKTKQIQQSQLHFLLLTLSKPQAIQNIGIGSINILYTLLYSITSLPPDQIILKQKVQNFLISFFKRQYDNVKYNYEYVVFIKYLLQNKLPVMQKKLLLKYIIQEGFQFNIIQKQTINSIIQIDFKVINIYYKTLFNIVYQQNFPTLSEITLSKQTAQHWPQIVLRYSLIKLQQLKWLQADLIRGINLANIRRVLKCIIFYSLPKFQQDYHLKFLSQVFKKTNQITYSLNSTIMETAIKSVKVLSINQSYAINPLHNSSSQQPIQQQQQNIKSNYKKQTIKQIRNFLYKIMTILCSNNSKLQIFSLSTHLDILTLCNQFNLPHIQYFTSLLQYYSNPNKNIKYEQYLQIFMRISKLSIINNPYYIEPIQKKLKQYEQNNKYIYQLIRIHKYTSSSIFYLRKLFTCVNNIDSLILRYVEKCQNVLFVQVNDIAKNYSNVRICQDDQGYEKLENIVKQFVQNNGNGEQKQKWSYENLYIGNNNKLLQLKNDKLKVKKIYAITGELINKSSVSLIDSLTQIIAGAYYTTKQNVYICNQYQAKLFFMQIQNRDNNENIKLNTLQQFQKMCKQVNKGVQIK